MSSVQKFEKMLDNLERSFHGLPFTLDGKEFSMLRQLDRCVAAYRRVPHNKELEESIERGIETLQEMLSELQKKTLELSEEEDTDSSGNE